MTKEQNDLKRALANKKKWYRGYCEAEHALADDHVTIYEAARKWHEAQPLIAHLPNLIEDAMKTAETLNLSVVESKALVYEAVIPQLKKIAGA